MRQVVFFAAMAVALIGVQAQAADSFAPVPVKIANPIEVPVLLDEVLAGLKMAADKQDLVAVLAQVGNSFFWASDHGGGFKASATPQTNFTNALNLDPKRVKAQYLPKVWAAFKALLDTRTASSIPGKSGVICLPGKGQLVNKTAAEKTAGKFDTDPWFGMFFAFGLPVAVREAAKNTAPIVGKIKNEAIIVRHKLRTDPNATWEPVQMANGVKGWVQSQQVRTFLDAQLCFAKGKGSAWKIVGYNGGGD